MKYLPEGKRDLRLGLLRGFCLFAMAINHGGLESELVPCIMEIESFFNLPNEGGTHENQQDLSYQG